MPKKTIDLDEREKTMLEAADSKSGEHGYLFITTLKRYIELTARLDDLQAEIEKTGATVTKEYVKGRGNLYVHPAVAAYNSTARAADSAAAMLLKYIDAPITQGANAADEFQKFKGNG